MARSVIFVNDMGGPVLDEWVLDELDGRVVPDGGTLDVTDEVSDDELMHAIQRGLGAEFITGKRYLRINGIDKTADESLNYGNMAEGLDPAPHSLGGGDHIADTLANLNSKLTDATLDDAGNPRDPTAHALDGAVHTGTITDTQHGTRSGDLHPNYQQESEKGAANGYAALNGVAEVPDTQLPGHPDFHEAGGKGEISIAGLAGVAGDPQIPQTHASSHEDGGADEISVANLSGELADPQPPKTHSSTHEDGGSDELSVDDLSTSEADTGKRLAPDGAGGVQWLAGGGVPAHASTHEDGGVDEISVEGLTGELADPQPPKAHAIGGSEHNASTLAQLNSKISDATLDDSGDPRDPNAHALSHSSLGGDPITPAAIEAEPEFSKNTAFNKNFGSGAGDICEGNDARLSDARIPTAHAASHQPGGGDAMAVDAAAATGSLRTVGTGALQACAGNDARLSDARTPTAHKDTHKSGGGDAFLSTDLLEATVKRIQESGGPTNLLVGAVADGEYLRRSGTNIVGGTPSGGSVFGESRAYNSADAETTYSGSTNWQQKVRLAAAIANAGTYRIEWYMEMGNQSSIANDILARAQVDDATTLFEVNWEMKDNMNYVPVSGFIETALAAGTRNIDLDYALENAGDTIAVRRARLSVFRVA